MPIHSTTTLGTTTFDTGASATAPSSTGASSTSIGASSVMAMYCLGKVIALSSSCYIELDHHHHRTMEGKIVLRS